MFGADGGAEDLHDEYLAQSLKKEAEQQVGAHITEWQVDLQYGVRDRHGKVWIGYKDRAEAEEFAEEGDTVVVHEMVLGFTEWREATPRGS